MTLTKTEPPSTLLSREDWVIPCLPTQSVVLQGVGLQGEGCHGEGHGGEEHRRDCCDVLIRSAAGDLHPYPRCFRLPQPLAQLTLPGEVLVASLHRNVPDHTGYAPPEFVIVGKDVWIVACGEGAGYCGYRVCSRISSLCSGSMIG